MDLREALVWLHDHNARIEFGHPSESYPFAMRVSMPNEFPLVDDPDEGSLMCYPTWNSVDGFDLAFVESVTALKKMADARWEVRNKEAADGPG